MATRWLITLGCAVACLASLAPTGCYRNPPAPRMTPIEVPPPAGAYTLDQVLADVLSGPLEHFGTGDWFGMFRVAACAYRNARVIVVNPYCTVKEKRAFGLLVLSPEHGRTYIYAEADGPISTKTRADYFTFRGEMEPARDEPELEPLTLSFTYAQLRAWDEKRYYRHRPACFGGVEIKRPLHGCYRGTTEEGEAWNKLNGPFLAHPPDDWYRIVKMLRERAPKDALVTSRAR